MKLLSPNLKAFIAVSECSSIAAAAKELNLTQAAVTLRIQGLERDLNATLFIRSRRGMTLTAAGETLARYCQRSLELEAELLPGFNDGASKSSPVTFAIEGPSSIVQTRVMPFIKDYSLKFPFVSLHLHIADLDSGIERLKKGYIDVLICESSQVTKEFDSVILKPERYVLVGPKSWRKRKIETILASERIVDFDPSDTMTINFLKKHNLDKLARVDRHFVNVTSGIASLVTQEIGYTVLSQEIAQPYFKSGELIDLLPGKILDYQVGLAWYPRKQMPPVFSEIIKMIKGAS